MTTQMQKYNLQQVNAILFAGFEYLIPDDTINVFNFLTAQIGSNAFVNSNVFQKREVKVSNDDHSLGGVGGGDQGFKSDKRKKKGNRGMEVSNEDWDTIRSFQTTKIEQKNGLDALVDKLKLSMSKLTKDKYILIRDQIVGVLNEIVEAEEDPVILIQRIGNIMLDIVLSNKTLLKLYADLYSDLLGSYDWLRQSIDNHFAGYLDLFKDMKYFDPDKDYDKFCDMNVTNEKRKLTSQLFVYLALNGLLPKLSIYERLVSLLRTMFEYINLPDKKFEVDEITENMAILFNKDIIKTIEDADDYDEDLYIINGLNIIELITVFAKSKAKDYKSLSNKSIFKCMDLVEM
jgi:hypothetical protein